MKIAENPVNAGIVGVIVGDALGLPVQFEPRSYRDRQPVTEMFGYGVFNVPPGSWSDDSSLTLCLVDALTKVSPTQPETLLKQISQNFCQWLKEGYLTPFGYSYDVGGTTEQAIGLAWGQKLSIQGRASFSGSGVEADRRVNQRVLNFPIAENPIFSLAIAKKPHSSCHKSTSSKACPAWHSA